MKKQIFITVFALTAMIFGAGNAMAQKQYSTTETNVHLILADIISISSESVAAGGQVDFQYKTPEDYSSTKTANVPNSLVITSTQSFDVDVKANGTHFEYGANKIPVGVLTIKPVTGGTTTMKGEPSEVVLSSQPQRLFTAAELGSKLALELDYVIPEEKSSSSDILGKPAGTYKQTITYTATAN